MEVIHKRITTFLEVLKSFDIMNQIPQYYILMKTVVDRMQAIIAAK